MFGALNPSYRAAEKTRRALLASFIHYAQPLETEEKVSHLNAVNAGRLWSGNSDDWALTACHYLEQQGYWPEYATGWAPLPTGGRTPCSFCILNGFVILPHQPKAIQFSELENLGYHISKSAMFYNIEIPLAP